MATFVQIEPDAFNKVFAAVTTVQANQNPFEDADPNQRIGLYHHVRRPVRGIQIKDETYGTLQVRQANGIAIPLFDAANDSDTGKGIRNSNFLIQSITEQRAEKQQIILTFGEPYIFFFGEQPRMINVTGVLLNTEDFNWRAEWWANYDLYLRGTQCVRQKTRVYLSWDDIVVEGYIVTSNAVDDASNRNLVQFQFQMFLTNYQNISSIGDPNAHWAGKEIDLNPSDIDLPGSGGTSSTLAVRQQNINNASLSSGQGSDSLFEFLRSATLGAATKLAQVQGQIVDFLSLAGQFVSGRNIRVPVGFEGAAAFDQEVQIAIGSVPGADQVINGNTNDRIVSFQPGGKNIVQEFRAVLNSRFGPAQVGLPLSANTDEFVARVLQDDTGAQKFNNLFAGQLASDQDAIDKVHDVFEAFGIDTDPPSDLTNFFKSAMFGIVSLAVGLELQNSNGARAALNTIGTVL